MKTIESLKIGIRQMRLYAFRSFLTLLGVIFGISAIISIFSIGAGAQKKIEQQMHFLGLNNIIIKKINPENDTSIYSTGLTTQNITRLQSHELVKKLSPLIKTQHNIMSPKQRFKTSVLATNANFSSIFKLQIKRGRFLSDIDIESYKQVCVIGAAVKKDLFGMRNPLGKNIILNNRAFEVIGELEEYGFSKHKDSKTDDIDIPIRDIDTDIFVPITIPMQDITKDKGFDELVIMVADKEDVFSAAKILERVIVRPDENIKNYKIIIPLELLKQKEKMQHIFNMVMGFIAALSLLVGGIGIMNIMLATVTERTREIGIRHAVGATRFEILKQFLVETAMLTSLGGIIGIFSGIVLSKFITLYAGWDTIITIKSIIAAFIISVGEGIIFGLYPAKKASELEPIDALRYE